jgi:hypothetical protein
MFAKSSSIFKTDLEPRRTFSISEEEDNVSNNVKAFARFRPLNSLEEEFGEAGIRFESESAVVIVGGLGEESFTFGRVFSPEASQKEVYITVGQPSVNDVVSGYNATVIAYGQSGSGKTFTMMGGDLQDDCTRGVIPRAIQDLFRAVMLTDQSTEFTFKCSLLEIYKEKLRDLFDVGCTDLRIKESPSRGIYVENLSEISVTSEAETFDILALGESMRTVGSTKLNAKSSRSHQLFMVEVVQKLPNDTEKRGVLNLVDLAGSEKIGWSGVTGNKLEETKKINLSLSALGNVIHALAYHADHIPYRDSKLTRLLQGSLGGNYKTYLVVTCSLNKRHLEETISTLKFGQRAGIIKNKVKLNIKNSPEAYQRIIDSLKDQLALAHHKLKAATGEDPDLSFSTSMIASTTTPTHHQSHTSLPHHTHSSDYSSPLVIDYQSTLKTPKRTVDSFTSVQAKHSSHESCEEFLTAEQVKVANLIAKLETSNRKVKELEASLAKNYQRTLIAEQRANEYYNNYHKLFRLIDKDGEEMRVLSTQNESLKGELKHLTKTLSELDSRYREALMNSMTTKGSTVEFENSEDLFMGEDHGDLTGDSCDDSYEGVDLRALPIGSFMLTQPLTTAHYEQLERNTEISREILVFNLRNQVVHAGLINSNIMRKYYALDWKHCLTSYRLHEKILQVDSLQQRLKSLEEVLDYQHLSYSSILKLIEKDKLTTSTAEDTTPFIQQSSISRVVTKKTGLQSNLTRTASLISQALLKSTSQDASEYTIKFRAVETNLFIQQSFSQQLKKALEDSVAEGRLKEQAISELEQRVYTAHRQETATWRTFVQEFKTNMETEVLRKHSEVFRLNEILGDWIHRYMELQEVTGIPSSRAKQQLHRRNLSSVYVNELTELINKTKQVAQPKVETRPIPKLESLGVEARTNSAALHMKRGDMSPPLSDR